jgi:hypothetical protein
MDDGQKAREIGERLARAVEANPENEWSIWAGLMAFPSSGSELWMPKEQAIAHWLDGQALVSATAMGQGRLQVVARPAVLGEWRAEVMFESAMLDEAGFARPGLKAQWKFRLPRDESFEVSGEVLVTRDSSSPNEAHKLASAITRSMIEGS